MNLQLSLISRFLSLSSLFFLAGCGTQYAYYQTESEVREFKGLSLEEFIREKIIDSDPVAAKAVLSVLDRLTKVVATVKGGRSINKERDYRKKNFIFRAAFDSRSHALTKPKKDLELFLQS